MKTTRHTLYLIAYHLVWVTKYRRTVLDRPMQAALKDVLHKTCDEHGYELMAVGAMPDHVYCIVNAPPKVAPSEIVKILKGTSARRMFQRFPALRLRVSKSHLWHPGTYIGTAGNVSATTIEKYINQQWERR